MKAVLHDYQHECVQFILDTPKCALWMDMGLGKTVTTLTALSELFDRAEVRRVLVIAPLRVANATWPAEIWKWAHLRHLSHVVATGSERNRLLALQSDAQIVMINRENVEWLVAQYKPSTWPFDCVVIDEASSFKSPSARRFKALRKARPYIDRVIQLTGTPAPNNLLNLWPQLFLLDGGERLGKTYTAYQTAYFEADYMGYRFTPREGAEKRIHDNVADICRSLSAADYLKMPDRMDVPHEIPLAQNVRDVYDAMERDYLIEFDDTEITAQNAAVLVNKLLQLSSGFMYDAEGRAQWFHDAKFAALDSILEEANGAPVLLAYMFQAERDELLRRYPQARVLDQAPETINEWNRGEIPLLLAHPASAGHGLNLQAGGNICVWFALPWSLELFMQFNARLHRQGQTKPVFIHFLMSQGTVDFDVLEALRAKDAGQSRLINAVKMRLEKLEKVAA